MHQRIQTFMKEITDARKAKKISQAELAREAGLRQGHLSRIERGLSDLRASNLIELARVLDLELMLIPKQYVPVVLALLSGTSQDVESIPAYGREEID